MNYFTTNFWSLLHSSPHGTESCKEETSRRDGIQNVTGGTRVLIHQREGWLKQGCVMGSPPIIVPVAGLQGSLDLEQRGSMLKVVGTWRAVRSSYFPKTMDVFWYLRAGTATQCYSGHHKCLLRWLVMAPVFYCCSLIRNGKCHTKPP